jgi:WD40 repeat protein
LLAFRTGYAIGMARRAVALLVFSAGLFAQHAEVQRGNVIFIISAGERHELTHSGRDFDASLSPDGKFIVFARAVKYFPPDDSGKVVGGPELAESELWMVPTGGRASAVRLFVLPEEPGFRRILASPQVSLDSKFVYVRDELSGTLWRYDLSARHATKLISAAISFGMIKGGRWRGYLIVQQSTFCNDLDGLPNRCYPFSLFSADGQEIRRIAGDEGNLEGLLEQYARP